MYYTAMKLEARLRLGDPGNMKLRGYFSRFTGFISNGKRDVLT